MLPALNKQWLSIAIIVQLAIGFWLFFAFCFHASKGAFIETTFGIGGRLGFSYFLYNILWFAWWGYLLALSMTNKYDLETWVLMKHVTGFFIIGNWLMTFIVIGAARQIAYVLPDIARNDSFFASAKAAIAALIVGMFTASAFLYYVISQKQAFLDSHNDNEPQAPTHLQPEGHAAQEAFYQGQSVGYQADSSNTYGTSTAF
jgi:signal transduction histidine kinase